MTDWFRRTTWTTADEADFFARFRRSRSRAQHLAIQAATLKETGDPSLAGPALRLADQLVAEYPEPFFLAGAHLTRAGVLLRLGRIGEAVEAFRASLAARRALPNVIDQAFLEYAWTVGRLGLREHFDEVLAVLEEFTRPTDLAFPANAYKYFGALAFISHHLGSPGDAKRWATNALRAASEGEGPFPRHRDVGIVKYPDPEAHEALWRLAAA